MPFFFFFQFVCHLLGIGFGFVVVNDMMGEKFSGTVVDYTLLMIGVALVSVTVIEIVFSVVAKTTSMMLCTCLLYTSPSPRDATLSRMPSSA